MNLKNFLSIICLLITATAFGQDKIFKKNGEIIEARIAVINSDYIVFKRVNNPNGPEYSIPKADVAKIRYIDGTEDIFEDNNDRIGVMRNGSGLRNDVYIHRNIIALAPVMITENGFGFGASYEHYLDKTGWVSFDLPLVATFRPFEVANGDTKSDPMVYLMPGIKIYTDLNTPRRAKFSIGPSFVIAAGRRTREESVYYGNTYYEESRFLLGTMLNGGFNIFPTSYLYIGGEYGLGVAYINQYNGFNKGISVLTQLSFKVGYRF